MRIIGADWLPAGFERAWVVVHAVWSVVGVPIALAAYGLSRVTSLDAADASWTVILVVMSIVTAVYAALYWLYARMTANVLRRVLPVFPDSNWTSLHLAIGAVLGVVTALAYRLPGQDDDLPLSSTEMIGLFVGMLLVGLVLGGCIGGLQALVLRKSASGLKAWIAYLALAGALCLPPLVLISQLYGPEEGWPSEVTTEALASVTTVLVAILTIPAVRRLRPRPAAPVAPV